MCITTELKVKYLATFSHLHSSIVLDEPVHNCADLFSAVRPAVSGAGIEVMGA